MKDASLVVGRFAGNYVAGAALGAATTTAGCRVGEFVDGTLTRYFPDHWLPFSQTLPICQSMGGALGVVVVIQVLNGENSQEFSYAACTTALAASIVYMVLSNNYFYQTHFPIATTATVLGFCVYPMVGLTAGCLTFVLRPLFMMHMRNERRLHELPRP